MLVVTCQSPSPMPHQRRDLRSSQSAVIPFPLHIEITRVRLPRRCRWRYHFSTRVMDSDARLDNVLGGGVFTFAPSSFRVWQSNKSYQLFSWNQPRFCLSAQRMSTSSGRPLNDFLIDTRTTQQRRYRNILDELFEYSCSNRRRTIHSSPYTQIPHT
jgi:hypothetical protein